MIPKKIHVIWFQGEANIPENYKKSLEEIKKFNPDWEVLVWDQHSLRQHCHTLGAETVQCFDKFKYMHQKIDLGRLAVLMRFGGVSVDLDVSVHKSFDDTPGLPMAKFIVSRSAKSGLEIILFSLGRFSTAFNNAIIFSQPDSKYVECLINEIVRSSNYRSIFCYYSIQWTTGPFLFTKVLKEIRDADVMILPSYYFEQDNFHEDAILSHHHANTWVPLWFKLFKHYSIQFLSYFF